MFSFILCMLTLCHRFLFFAAFFSFFCIFFSPHFEEDAKYRKMKLKFKFKFEKKERKKWKILLSDLLYSTQHNHQWRVQSLWARKCKIKVQRRFSSFHCSFGFKCFLFIFIGFFPSVLAWVISEWIIVSEFLVMLTVYFGLTSHIKKGSLLGRTKKDIASGNEVMTTVSFGECATIPITQTQHLIVSERLFFKLKAGAPWRRGAFIWIS